MLARTISIGIALGMLVSIPLVHSAGLPDAQLNPLDQRQSQQLIYLKSLVAGQQVKAVIEEGAVKQLEVNLPARKLQVPGVASADDFAFAFLKAFEGLLRLDSPDQSLRLVKRAGERHKTLHFRQYYQGIPVFGAWLQLTIGRLPNKSKASRCSLSLSRIKSLSLTLERKGRRHAFICQLPRIGDIIYCWLLLKKFFV
jgi:hypothetical protein